MSKLDPKRVRLVTTEQKESIRAWGTAAPIRHTTIECIINVQRVFFSKVNHVVGTIVGSFAH